MIKSRKIKYILSAVLAVIMCVCTLFAIIGLPDFSQTAHAVTEGDRVKFIDLYNRYPIGYVVGPVDVEDVNKNGVIGDRGDLNEYGKYTYKDTNLDIDGKPTNNIYGIPAEKYFNVESYIHTKPDAAGTGRILYGWKANIQAIPTVKKADGGTAYERTDTTGGYTGLAENGEMLGAETTLTDTPSDIGIYVTYTTGSDFGTTEQYAMIVPSDITSVAAGAKGYFVANGNKYWADNSYTCKSDTASATDYTDFGCFITDRDSGLLTWNWEKAKENTTRFWQPRERLAGVYFPSDSKLTTITDGGNPGDNNRLTKMDRATGKPAFAWCGAMRFCILPTTVSSIGDYAFSYCDSLVDANTASATVSGNAYTGSTHRVNGTGNPTFVMGNKPLNGVLDTGAFIFQKSGNNVAAVQIAGETGEAADKVFVFPSGEDFTDDSDRRRGVAYDYIDSSGNKQKYKLSEIFSNGVSSYTIQANFAKEKWCQNIVLPKAVTSVGDSAFYNSHVSYLEIYDTTKIVGSTAFTDAGRVAKDTQWFYILDGGTTGKITIDKGVFSEPGKADSTKTARHIIYENYDLYHKYGEAAPANLSTGKSGTVQYQIPFKVNVHNEDTTARTLKGGDLAERFFNDSDYTKNPVISAGTTEASQNSSFVYTKRLNLYGFTYTKNRLGEWTTSGNTDRDKKPTLNHMESTEWYANAGYTGSSVSADNLFANRGTKTQIDLYTKNIAPAQNIKDKKYKQTYTFGSDGVGETSSIDYYTALALNSNNYEITLNDFTFPDGRTKWTSNTSALQHAGEYLFGIGLNPKWGKWSQEYIDANKGYFDAAVTVNRKKLEFKDITAFEFANAANDTYKLNGSATPLYRYSDGWYLAQQKGNLLETRTVTNAVSYGGNSVINIKLVGETFNGEETSATATSSTYNGLEIISRNGLSGIAPMDYNATFTFQVKFIPLSGGQSDYEIEYASQFDESDEYRGLTMTGKNQFTFRLSKRWYIVKETNMFVVSGTQQGSTNGTPYSPFEGGTNVTYADNFTLRQPELNFGHADGLIKFDLSFTPVNGTAIYLAGTGEEEGSLILNAAGAENSLAYYINRYMPAGKYTLNLYGAAVTVGTGADAKHYDSISGEYDFTVDPKAIDSAAFDSAIATGGEKGTNEYSHKYDGQPHVYGNVTDTALATLNATLAGELAAVQASSTYWAEKADYYSNAVAVAYNLDRSGNTVYVDLASLPVAADEYTVYYSISANNYKTHGGAADDNRRDKKFKVLIYNNVSVKQNLLQSEIFEDAIYFRDVTYTGGTVQTLVPYSQFFSYAFNDTEGYINARKKATVTLTLNNLAPAKWGMDVTGDVAARFTLVDDKTLTAYFDILPADNRWEVTPSVSGWSYNGFDSEVHVISSKLAFGNTRSYYRLSLDPNGGNWITFGENDYFEVNSDGKVTDTAVINVLKTLKPDSYYLFGFADAYEDGNVKAFDPYTGTNPASGVLVVIGKAANRWTVSPDIIRWYWSEYKPTVNVISGSALYLNVETLTGKTIKYAILDGKNNVVDGLYGITVDINGVIVDDAGNTIANKIKALGRGTYYLLATVDETDYYTGINEYTLTGTAMSPKVAGETLNPTRFVISQFINKWNTTSPSMTSWEYQAFVPGNFTAGDPVFGEAADIEYIISGNGITPITFKGALDAETIAKLKALAVNDTSTNSNNVYTISATLPEPASKNYSKLTYSSAFSVTRVNNAWTTNPVLTGWAYKGFATTNFAEGKVALNDNGEEIGYAIYNGTSIAESATPVITFTADQIGDEDILNALNGLAVGDYIMRATLGGTSDNYLTAPYDVPFSVTKVNNTWSTAPILTGWAFDAFSAANFTAGVPTLKEVEGAEVSYTITRTDGKPLKVNGVVVSSLALEIVTEIVDGKEVRKLSDASVTALNSLEAGNYSMAVYYTGNNNYNELDPTITFTVASIPNRWTKSPTMTSWAYNSFTADNFVKGEPVYGGTDGVTYTVSGNGISPITLAFRTDAGHAGELTEDTVNALKALSVGDYTISAHVNGTNEYSELSYSAPFSVNVINNTWTTNPVLTGWDYKAFVASNFKAGDLAFKDGDANIIYAIYRGTSIAEGVTPIITFSAITEEGLESELNGLSAGDYIMRATLDKTNANYTTLPYDVSFHVNRASNSWTTNPVLTGWEYKAFAATNFKAGEVALNDDDAAITYVISGNEISPITLAFITEGEHKGELTADTVTALNGLKVGNYVMTATFGSASTNYETRAYDVPFAITKVNNTWSTAPVLTGWAYNAFSASNFTAGEPALDEAKTDGTHETVTYVLKKGGAAVADFEMKLNADGTLTEDMIKYFNVLDYGSYTLSVTFAGNDNYNVLERDIDFTVAAVANRWITSPSITSWTYKSYNGNFTAGEPAFNKEGIKYVLSKKGESGYEKVADFNGTETYNFNALEVGEYQLQALVEGNANYGELKPVMTFSVNKVINTWKVTPGMTGWSYGNFAAGNFRAGESVWKENTEAAVSYTLYDAENTELKTFTDINNLGGFDFNTLGKGNYKIIATYPGTGNYDAITQEITFNVTQVNNTWSTAPILTGWAYNAFSESNFTAGVPALNEKLNDGTYAKVTYALTKGGAAVAGFEMKLNADGTLTDDMIKYFNNLGMGSYTLSVTFAENDNYGPLLKDIDFTVASIPNRWTTSPVMTSWAYGAFTADNFVKGVAAYGTPADITYTVSGNGIEDIALAFRTDEGHVGELTEATVNKLKALSAGTYTFKAYLAGATDGEYAELEYSGGFTVTPVNNTWSTVPGMTGWVYKQYDATRNFRAGVPTLDEADENGNHATVQYTLYKGTGKIDALVKIDDFTSVSLYDFAGLGVGDYTIVASFAGATNYNSLTQEITFTVSQFTNSWTTNPVLTGWEYKAFATTNFKAGEVALNDDDAAITYVISGNEISPITLAFITEGEHKGELTAETVTALNGLKVGNYVMTATLGGTNSNYETPAYNVNFAVTKVNNTWSTTPGMTGWVYKQFAASNFRAGVPALQEDTTAKVQYTLSLNEEGVTVIKKFENVSEYNFAGLAVGNYKIIATYTGTDNYNSLEQTITFTVSQFTNSWTTAPRMTGWTYGLYNDNFVKGVPAIKKDGEEVKYVLVNSGTGKTIATFYDSDNYDFNSLAVGEYELTASIEADGTNYGALSTSVPFSVIIRTNTWQTTPGMTGWSYGNFAAGNFRAGVPANNENSATVKYVLYDKDEKQLKEFTIIDVSYFTALSVGDYKIIASLEKSTNYTALSQEITFNVTPVANSWQENKSPILTGWAYGQFSESSFRAGVPTLDEAYENGTHATVQYALAKGEGEFTAFPIVVENGKLSQTTIANLNALTVGSYTLTVTFAGNTNYDELKTEVHFNVAASANSWSTTPGLIGWQYTGFSADVNFIKGVPANSIDGAQVQYGIFVGNAPTGNSLDGAEKTFTDIESVTEYLKGLSADTYYLAAYYPGDTTRYSAMFTASVFNVAQAPHNNITTTVNTGTYNPASTEKIVEKVEASFGADTATFALTKKVGEEYVTVTGYESLKLEALSNIELGELGAGDYKIQAVVGETGNYAAASGETRFNVPKADIKWVDDTAPSLDKWSWTYGEAAAKITERTLADDDGGRIKIEYRFYERVYENGEYKKGNLISVGNPPENAGSYIFVVYTYYTHDGVTPVTRMRARAARAEGDTVGAKESQNFNVEETDSGTVTINTYANGWEVTPENSLSWTWSEHESERHISTSGIVTAKAQMPNENGTVTYVIVNKADSTKTYNADHTNIYDVLSVLPVGSYEITITSQDGGNNYNAVTATADLTVYAEDLTWATAPKNAIWTWGDTEKTVVNPVVNDVYTSKAEVSYTFTVSLGGNVIATFTSYNDLVNGYEGDGGKVTGIKDYNAGDYSIRIVASCANYNDLTATVTLSIAKADFTWSSDPNNDNASWIWGVADADKYMPAEPTVTDVENKDVTYTVTRQKDGDEQPTTVPGVNGKSAYATLVDWIRNGENGKAGTYTVTLAVKGVSNYNDSAKSFTVTISEATNSFTNASAYTQSINKEYQDNITADDLVLATALHGTPVYDIGTKETSNKEEILAHINRLGVSNEDYTITITVVAADGKYTGLTSTLTVRVRGIGTSWKNISDLTPNPTAFYYSARVAEMGKIKLPQRDLLGGDSITFTVKYATSFDAISEAPTSREMNETALRAYLTSEERNAGYYQVYAKYNPPSEGYAPLDYTINITVMRDVDEWAQTYENKYEGRYTELEVPDFKAKNLGSVENPVKRSVNVKITYENGNLVDTTQAPSAYFKTASVGRYFVVISVTGDDNYTGIAEKSIEVVVNAAFNSWADGTTFTDMEIERGKTFDITTPTATFGTDTMIVLFDGVSYDKDVYSDINDYLNKTKPAAGQHTIEFRIPESSGNYNGLSGKYNITVKKLDNNWVSGKEPNDVQWLGTQDKNYVLPEALKSNELLRFDYSKVGSTTESGTRRLATEFVSDVTRFTNGVYRVTAYIGYEALSNDPYYTVISAYNADYNVLSATFEITITLTDNSFTTGLENKSWTYGETYVSPTLAAEQGIGTVTYTITGTTASGEEIETVTCTATEGGESAKTKLDNELKKLVAGTYVVTANIAATPTYGGATCSAMYTVKIFTATWKDTYEDEFGWKYGATHENLPLPEADREVKYYFVNAEGVESELALVDYNTVWTNKDVGTYKVIARIAGETDKYTALEFTMTVVISQADNGWTSHVSDGATKTWSYGNYVKDSIAYEAAQNNELLSITINNTEFTGNDLQEHLKTRPVGTYVIVASVPANGNYGALSETVTVTVTKEQDGWKDDTALKVKGWTWDNYKVSFGDREGEVNWQLPVPKYASEISITIDKLTAGGGIDANFNQIPHNIQRVGDALDTNGIETLQTKLKALGAGTYKITVTIADTDNYTGHSESAEFTVGQATNDWISAPAIGAWDYGYINKAIPESNAYYGNATVVYTYAPAQDREGNDIAYADVGNDVWSTTQPTDQGKYWLRGYIAGTDEYTELYGHSSFAIGLGDNTWSVSPSVTGGGWQWNAYNANTNTFVGAVPHQESISFKILKGEEDVSGNLLDKSYFIKADGTEISDKQLALIQKAFTYDGDSKLLGGDIAEILKALKPGNYYLYTFAEGSTNYDDNKLSTPFTVSRADNNRTSEVKISDYTYGAMRTSGNNAHFTAGATAYGEFKYSIGQNGDKKNAAGILKDLEKLDAGTYILYFSVDEAENGTYKGIQESALPFTVEQVTNRWQNSGDVKEQLREIYSEIQAMVKTADENTPEGTIVFSTWYPDLKPLNALSNDNPKGEVAKYALLDSEKRVIGSFTGLSYDELFAAIKSRPAGEYFIRAWVEASKNYTDIGDTDTILVISSFGNSFTEIPDEITAQWKRENGANATELDDFTVLAALGGDTVTYTINNVTYENDEDDTAADYKSAYDKFKEAVKALDAKSYNVIIAVEATSEYEGLSETIMLTVRPGTNSWKNDWTKETQFKNASGAVTTVWRWNDAITWIGAEPEYGDTIEMSIKIKNSSESVLHRTVVINDNFAASVADISRAISALNRGEYEITVTAVTPAGANWNPMSVTSYFTVNTRTNAWSEYPQLVGAQNNKWEYGSTVIPRSAPLYGDVVMVYKDKNGATLKAMPTEVGEYSIVFTVPESATKNYTKLEQTVNVEIVRATDNHVTNFTATGWTWNAYNYQANVFTGVPATGGAVTVSVFDGEGKAIFENVKLVDESGVHTGNPINDKFVPENLRDMLNGLLAGTYTLRMNVAQTANYNAFVTETTFVVGLATNGWDLVPSIVTWPAGNYDKAENTPNAVPYYGDATIVITARHDNGREYFRAVYHSDTGVFEEQYNNLARGAIGVYDLTATVPASAGRYGNALENTISFQIFVQGSPDDQNFWIDPPQFTSWEANLDGVYNLPTAKPARGLVWFEFYKVNEDGSKGDVISAESEFYTLIEAGDTYYQDWYLPVEPGDYLMVGHAVSEGEKPLDDLPRPVKINYRPNSFTEEPRIETLLYLGSRDVWNGPTATTAVNDSSLEIVYSYKNMDTGVVVKNEMPTEPGRYQLTATVNAQFCKELVSLPVEFRVELSDNKWLEAPGIDDWSEEFDPENPFGDALIGSEYIKYEYASVSDPTNFTDVKPTTEGEYILRATLDVYGYVPLEYEHYFTIDPAFDRDLLVVDIILGTVACALAVTVIVFAIRRYKEN